MDKIIKSILTITIININSSQKSIIVKMSKPCLTAFLNMI